MGWVLTRAWRIGVGGITEALKVEEPAGHKGKWLTPAGQGDDPLRIERKKRTVHSSKRAALAEKR